MTVQVDGYGDSAVLVTVRGGSQEERWRSTHAIATALRHHGHPAVLDVMPTYDTILVEFDCSLAHPADVTRTVHAVAADASPWAPDAGTRRFAVPVRYGGEHGPDLESLADELGLAPADVVNLHANRWYRIRCIGSPAGAPMTDGPDLPAPVRRLATPRVRVPEGTVAVAGRQANIYATSSPGGWRLLGRTPLRLFDVTADPPFPYRPGDEIRFFAIGDDEWSAYAGERLEAADDHGR